MSDMKHSVRLLLVGTGHGGVPPARTFLTDRATFPGALLAQPAYLTTTPTNTYPPTATTPPAAPQVTDTTTFTSEKRRQQEEQWLYETCRRCREHLGNRFVQGGCA